MANYEGANPTIEKFPFPDPAHENDEELELGLEFKWRAEKMEKEEYGNCN